MYPAGQVQQFLVGAVVAGALVVVAEVGALVVVGAEVVVVYDGLTTTVPAIGR